MPCPYHWRDDAMTNRRARVLLLLAFLVMAAIVGLAAVAYAYSVGVCDEGSGEWWITIYDDSGNITGTFHGFGGHYCPIRV